MPINNNEINVEAGSLDVTEPLHTAEPLNADAFEKLSALNGKVVVASTIPSDFQTNDAEIKDQGNILNELEQDLSQFTELLQDTGTFAYTLTIVGQLRDSHIPRATALGAEVVEQNLQILLDMASSSKENLHALLEFLVCLEDEDRESQYAQTARRFVEIYFDPLLNASITGNEALSASSTGVLYDYLAYYYEREDKPKEQENAKKIIGAFSSSVDDVIDRTISFGDPQNIGKMSRMIKTVLSVEDEEKRAQIEETILNKVRTEQDNRLKRAGNLLVDVDSNDRLVIRYLESCGFNRRECRYLINDWVENTNRTIFRNKEVRIKNLETISLLERHEEGSTKVLKEEFNINNPSRWPVKWLKRQYERRDSFDRPALLWIKPRYDDLGAKDLTAEEEKLFDSLGEEIDLIGVEAGSYDWDFQNAHERICNRSNKQRKLLGAVWDAHGSAGPAGSAGSAEETEAFIVFGDYGTDKVSTDQHDAEGVNWEEIKKCYVEHPQIIIAACQSGVDGGIAEFVSRPEILDAKVTGSPVIYSYLLIDKASLGDDNKVDVQVTYNGGFRVVFDRGVKIEDLV